MSNEQGESTFRLTANRRDVLRAATGAAAVAVAGSALINGQQVANAQGNSKRSGISASVEGIGEFEVLSFTWEVSNTFADGGGAGGGAGRTDFDAFVCTKPLDAATPRLQEAVASGRHLMRATVMQADNRGNPYFTYTLEDIVVSSSRVDASPGNAPTEQVSFVFEKVTLMVGAEGYEWDTDTNTGGLLP